MRTRCNGSPPDGWPGSWTPATRAYVTHSCTTSRQTSHLMRVDQCRASSSCSTRTRMRPRSAISRGDSSTAPRSPERVAARWPMRSFSPVFVRARYDLTMDRLRLFYSLQVPPRLPVRRFAARCARGPPHVARRRCRRGEEIGWRVDPAEAISPNHAARGVRLESECPAQLHRRHPGSAARRSLRPGPVPDRSLRVPRYLARPTHVARS